MVRAPDHADTGEARPAAGPVPAPDQLAPPLGWAAGFRRLLHRWAQPGGIGFTGYLAVLVWYCLTHGLPLDRIGQTAWILGGILAAGLGRTWREHVRVFVDWLPLLAALVLYDHTRGIADTLGMTVRVGELVDAEYWMFGREVPTLWLQERLYDATEVHWWEVGVAIVYFTHFVLPWAVAAVLYFRSRPLWVRYIRRVLLLSYAGLLTYILVPAAPPWYAAMVGEIPGEIARIATRGWWEVGLPIADTWLQGAQADANQVAALPSLHAAFSLLVVVALWPFVARIGPGRLGVLLGYTVRTVLAVFPLAMAFTLVYGGEHYMVDVVAGWLYVVLVCLGASWWERRRESVPSDTMPVTR